MTTDIRRSGCGFDVNQHLNVVGAAQRVRPHLPSAFLSAEVNKGGVALFVVENGERNKIGSESLKSTGIFRLCYMFWSHTHHLPLF
jgi:hypothetical protein